MDSAQITDILNKHCSALFLGVFAADNYEITKVPCFLVLNTDASDRSGQHWVCLYINQHRSEFFDSEGCSPLSYHTSWHDTLLSISPSYCYNSLKLQEPGSRICGQLCIAYAILRNHGFSFQSILKMLKKINLQAFISRLV